jgi:hypothetical protein
MTSSEGGLWDAVGQNGAQYMRSQKRDQRGFTLTSSVSTKSLCLQTDGGLRLSTMPVYSEAVAL